MPHPFQDFDLTTFWEDSDYAREAYVEEKATPALIKSIENDLGVNLPGSYLELMQTQNGGIPRNTCFPIEVQTSWAENHVAISGIMGIGRKKRYSLCGELGSKFMQEMWGYTDLGICVCNCPSAGHDMIMLDFRECGIEGEPTVVHVDQERDYRITFLARDFETFIRGLVNESVYDTSAEDLKASLADIERGSFSTLLTKLVRACRETDFDPVIRNICRRLAVAKGCFALHADETSYLLYDIQFYLYSRVTSIRSKQEYLDAYPEMIAFGDGDLTTGGYAPDFIKEWFEKRRANGEIIVKAGNLSFSNAFLKTLAARVRESNK